MISDSLYLLFNVVEDFSLLFSFMIYCDPRVAGTLKKMMF